MEGIRMQKRHVELDNEARKKIKMVLRSKKVSMEAKKRAQILLDIDESGGRKPESLSTITAKRGVCQNTIVNVRRNYAERGVNAAIFIPFLRKSIKIERLAFQGFAAKKTVDILIVLRQNSMKCNSGRFANTLASLAGNAL